MVQKQLHGAALSRQKMACLAPSAGLASGAAREDKHWRETDIAIRA